VSKTQAPANLRGLMEAAGAALNSIKLNCISTRRHRGRPLRVKRRKRGSEQIAALANMFFPLAKAPIIVLGELKEWQRWEVGCFRLLNGDAFKAFALGPRTVCAEKLPGRSLRRLAAIGKLHTRALQAAAVETLRAHQLHCHVFNGPWSHGDLHLGNVIYDERTERARLIDFEIVHHKSMSSVSRHADDLLGFLQDMAGSIPGRQWLRFALCFLDAYGQPPVIARMQKLLVVPEGIPGFWWKIRCNYLDRAKMVHRMETLRRSLEARDPRRIPKAPLEQMEHHRSPARVVCVR
jgi:hypothetical protein